MVTTVGEVENLVAKIWSIKRLQELYPRAFRSGPPRVKDGRGTRIARGGESYINIPLWARKTDIIIHEACHTISMREYDRIAYHGWEFCAVYLEVTLSILGEDAYSALLKSFRKHGVKFKKPVKRVLTEEQRAALVARAAVARAARKKD